VPVFIEVPFEQLHVSLRPLNSETPIPDHWRECLNVRPEWNPSDTAKVSGQGSTYLCKGGVVFLQAAFVSGVELNHGFQSWARPER
jgi:hypothetical protein